MKKAILGFITGFTVAITCSGFAQTAIQTFTAEKATFDVVINGQELKSDKPAVVIDGSTYLPLRDTGEALNVPVNWNNELKRVEIGDMEQITLQPASPGGIVLTENPITKEEKQSAEVGSIKNNTNIDIEILEINTYFNKKNETEKKVRVKITNKSDKATVLNKYDFSVRYNVPNLAELKPPLINWTVKASSQDGTLKANITDIGVPFDTSSEEYVKGLRVKPYASEKINSGEGVEFIFTYSMDEHFKLDWAIMLFKGEEVVKYIHK